MPNSRQLLANLGLADLEKHALLETSNGRRKVFATYLAMREKVSSDFLPLIPSTVPYVNDHSQKHLQRVLANIEHILVRNFPKPSGNIGDIPAGSVITWTDILILLNALVWHDIGNVYGRRNHADAARRCLNAIASELYDEHFKNCIIQVAQAHSGTDGIQVSIPNSHAASSYNGEDIHLSFLAAVLRFADEIDEDYRRAEPHTWEQMELIPAQSQRFWFFGRCNSGVKITHIPMSNSFEFWVNVETHIPMSEFPREFFYNNTTQVPAATEYFRRIRKFEAERRYCNGFMRKAYYHPGISGFKVKLTTYEHSEAPNQGKVFSFSLTDEVGFEQLINDPSLVQIRDYIRDAMALEI